MMIGLGVVRGFMIALLEGGGRRGRMLVCDGDMVVGERIIGEKLEEWICRCLVCRGLLRSGIDGERHGGFRVCHVCTVLIECCS